MKRRKISYVSRVRQTRTESLFEKFAIKHFFCENWGDLNTFFFYYLSRGGLKWLISYHLAIQQKVTEKSSYYWTIAPCCTELYT